MKHLWCDWNITALLCLFCCFPLCLRCRAGRWWRSWTPRAAWRACEYLLGLGRQQHHFGQGLDVIRVLWVSHGAAPVVLSKTPQFLQGLSFSCLKIQVNGWESLCLNSCLLLLSPRGAYRGGKMLSDLVLLKSKLLGDSICSVANIWNLNPVILKVKLSLGWSLVFPACILHLDCLGIR